VTCHFCRQVGQVTCHTCRQMKNSICVAGQIWGRNDLRGRLPAFATLFCIIFFGLFALFMSMHFKPQKLDIVLKKNHHHLSSALTIRYRRAEVLVKTLLYIDIFILFSALEL
jgi:hypothetical protein